MKMNISFIENNISFKDNIVNVLEIENKKYLYRIISNLFAYENNGYCEDIIFINSDNEEASTNIKVFVDFFNLPFLSKKTTSDIIKYVGKVITEEDKNKIISAYKKIVHQYTKILNNIDLPIEIASEFDIDSITKLMQVSINPKDELLENILLLIDLEKILNTKSILFFCNLKQYLTKAELIELYKYGIYNNIKICLIDSQAYGTTIDYEKKYIIDDNLDEFVL